jgi:hypothetical protein
LTVGAIAPNHDGSWTIPVTYTVTNIGATAATPPWNDIGYLSIDAVLDNGDQSNGVLLANTSTTIAAGQSYTRTVSYTTSTTTAIGNYTFFLKTDGSNAGTGGTNTDNGQLPESNETNNVASATVTLSRPDLSIGPLTLGTIVKNQDGSWGIPITYTVTNIGAAASTPPWNDVGYLSTNAVLDNADQSNGVLLANASATIAAGQSYTRTVTYTTTTTTAAGTYTFFLKTDGSNTGTGGTNTDNGQVPESNKSNNVASVSVTLQ